MFGLGVPEIIVIAIIILLIFGAKRLPGIGEGLGKTVKELRNAKKEISGIKKSEAKKEVGDRIDYALIVTPNHVHYDPAMRCIDAGIPVFCEKPLTVTLEEELLQFPAIAIIHDSSSATEEGTPGAPSREAIHNGKRQHHEHTEHDHAHGHLALDGEGG